MLMYNSAKRQALERAEREQEVMVISQKVEQRAFDRESKVYYYVRSVNEPRVCNSDYEEYVLPPNQG